MSVLDQCFWEYRIVIVNSRANNPSSTRASLMDGPPSTARPGGILRFGPVVGAVLFLAACGSNPADAQSSTPERIAEVQHACATTMQLDPSEELFEGCAASLTQTLAAMDQTQLVERDRRACMQRGFQPGTREFALCVVDAQQPGN
jgi:hypothetical protein